MSKRAEDGPGSWPRERGVWGRISTRRGGGRFSVGVVLAVGLGLWGLAGCAGRVEAAPRRGRELSRKKVHPKGEDAVFSKATLADPLGCRGSSCVEGEFEAAILDSLGTQPLRRSTPSFPKRGAASKGVARRGFHPGRQEGAQETMVDERSPASGVGQSAGLHTEKRPGGELPWCARGHHRRAGL